MVGHTTEWQVKERQGGRCLEERTSIAFGKVICWCLVDYREIVLPLR